MRTLLAQSVAGVSSASSHKLNLLYADEEETIDEADSLVRNAPGIGRESFEEPDDCEKDCAIGGTETGGVKAADSRDGEVWSSCSAVVIDCGIESEDESEIA